MQIHPVLSAKISQSTRDLFPVIIYAKKTIPEVRGCIEENYGRIKYELPFINAVAVEISREKIQAMARYSTIRLITEDALVTKTMFHHSAPKNPANAEPSSKDSPIPVPRRAFRSGYTVREERRRDPLFYRRRGQGVAVAVIDTGIAPHYDLIYPKNRIVAFKDFVNGRTSPYDDDGHGSHVSGIIAGNGYASQKFIGSAPSANLIGIKALDGDGNGTASDILAAMQWILDHKEQYNIRVVNLSLGITADVPYEDDPLVRGANAVVKGGVSVIAAAGNNGPSRGSINSPGISPYVVTVGAADFTKASVKGQVSVADFSSRGPTAEGLPKPDLLASGVEIRSLDARNPKGYAVQTGTSMAAPSVSGVAACLYAMRPELSPMQIKRILTRDALPLKRESRSAQGCGVLNYEVLLDYF